MADPAVGRPFGPPRVPVNPPSVPLAGRISSKPEDFPDFLNYDAEKHRLLVGHGYIDNVSSAVWAYEVSGKHVLTHWFSYRKLHRERPVIERSSRTIGTQRHSAGPLAPGVHH